MGEVAGTVHETDLPERVLENEQGFFSRLEAIFVGATLLLLIAGLLVERYYGRGVVWTAMFTGAYFFGGYFGVLGGIESIKQRKIDVDILMVLAALGAAYVGAPFEGAMLLFLFSFSNLLQDLGDQPDPESDPIADEIASDRSACAGKMANSTGCRSRNCRLATSS